MRAVSAPLRTRHDAITRIACCSIVCCIESCLEKLSVACALREAFVALFGTRSPVSLPVTTNSVRQRIFIAASMMIWPLSLMSVLLQAGSKPAAANQAAIWRLATLSSHVADYRGIQDESRRACGARSSLCASYEVCSFLWHCGRFAWYMGIECW